MEPLAIPVLTTERLRLRPFRGSDLDDYAAMYADPEVVRHLGRESGAEQGRVIGFSLGAPASSPASFSSQRPARMPALPGREGLYSWHAGLDSRAPPPKPL